MLPPGVFVPHVLTRMRWGSRGQDFKTHIDRIMNKLVGLVRSSATARLKGIEVGC